MKVFVLLMIVFSMVSCSHHYNKAEHHHHQFDKKCAYEVSLNHLDVEGKEEYKFKHEGEVYYFSSNENMQKFKADIQANLSKSKTNWKKGPPSSRSN
jgi:YHS domain-containing protein